jgi:hypothetical protein
MTDESLDEQPTPHPAGPRLVRYLSPAVFLVTAVVLITLITIGYWRTRDGNLLPNSTFGFRSASSLASLSAWEAAQTVGFSALMFLGCPVLVVGAIATIVGFIRKWSIARLTAIYAVSLALFGGAAAIAIVRSEHAATSAAAVAVLGNTASMERGIGSKEALLAPTCLG